MIIGMDVSSYPEMKIRGIGIIMKMAQKLMCWNMGKRKDLIMGGCDCGMRRKIYRNLADIVICCKRLQWQNG